MTALIVVDRAAGRRQGPRDQGGAGLQGLGRRRAAQGQARQARDDAQRAAAAVGQRRGHRPRPAHERHGGALRRADERARADLGLACTRLSSPTASTTPAITRARSTSPRSRAPCSTSRAWRASSGAGERCCRSRSRADGSTCSTTTRCCARATRHHRDQDGLHRRRRALPRGGRAARRTAPRRGAPALARPGQAGDPAAQSRLRGPVLSGPAALRRSRPRVPIRDRRRRASREPPGRAPAS